MIKHNSLVIRFYDHVVLEYPRIVIFGILLLISFLSYKAADFRLDASTETLIIETDADLRYSRLIKSRYGGYDYLLITYTPKSDLFSEESLKKLTQLRDDLKQTKRVTSVVSILDAPLLESPPVPVKELTTSIQTLESPKVDRKLARIEFKESPLYQNLLVSPDLKTTGLQVNFPVDEVYQDLLARRDHFREKAAKDHLTDAEIIEFKELKKQIQRRREIQRQIRNEDIAAIRAIMDKYRQDAQLFLGGISVITDDLIRFVRQDLKIFGIGIALFLIITLSIIFGKIRWVVLPMLCCVFSVIAMMGLLGMFGWKVTVISSNFISLQLIITMAITIHLIVRYKDLATLNPEADQRQLILDTVGLMLTPCLYAALTTIAGFGSLLLCDILPVRTFGWMMSAGIAVSLIVTFLLFPAGLMLLSKEAPQAINEVFRRDRVAIRPARIRADSEGVGKAVRRDLPAFRRGRDHRAAGVVAHQALADVAQHVGRLHAAALLRVEGFRFGRQSPVQYRGIAQLVATAIASAAAGEHDRNACQRREDRRQQSSCLHGLSRIRPFSRAGAS